MFHYLLFIFIFTTSFSQTIDERLLLIETQNILTYGDTFEQIVIESVEDYAVASNVTNSIVRSLNILMNTFHLIHIYHIIEGEEDKMKVGDYLRGRITQTSRLLKTEVKLATRFTSSSKSKQIKDITELYVNSLDFVIKLLNDSS